MKNIFKNILACAMLVAIFSVTNVFAETTIVECPKVYAKNPFNLLRVENGEGWETTEASGYQMYCRAYINPQGYITCYYPPAAHGGSDVFTLKRMPPKNTTCKETNISCRFECTSTPEPPKTERAVKPLKPIQKKD
jgi:hypothetical protein